MHLSPLRAHPLAQSERARPATRAAAAAQQTQHAQQPQGQQTQRQHKFLSATNLFSARARARARMDRSATLPDRPLPDTVLDDLYDDGHSSLTSREDHSVRLDDDYDDEEVAAAVPADISMASGQQPPRTRRDFSSRHHVVVPSPHSDMRNQSASITGSDDSYDDHDITSQSQAGSGETAATSIQILPALQAKGPPNPSDRLEPLEEDDGSYDLVAPHEATSPSQYSLETRSLHIFSHQHLRAIFKDPPQLLKFTNFLAQHRTESVPTLNYYLDAIKAIRAIGYANAVATGLAVVDSLEWTRDSCPTARNEALEQRASMAFDRMVREDLPAYVTHTWVAIVSESIQRRITGNLPPNLREASEGLAEVFCLTDPSREDNPIVFASEEFHRTTQYGMGYAIGRNCRFLQGPQTNKDSVRRLRDAVRAGKEVCETFLNYRRDGSPFMNLIMVAPLRDSRGHLRYFIGAQVDVSGLALEAAELDALQVMLADQGEDKGQDSLQAKDEMTELSEMFTASEIDVVRKTGGRYRHCRPAEDGEADASWQRPRLLLKDNSPPLDPAGGAGADQLDLAGRNLHGRLQGIYSQYLLVRPHPSLKILFASPALRIPGILQSPFMDRIGSSERVREELRSALAEGRGVTAKVRWVSRQDTDGRPRWIHCTPLIGHNGSVGVWMIVLVDDESFQQTRKFRHAPPVPLQIERKSNAGVSFRDSMLPPLRERRGVDDQRASHPADKSYQTSSPRSSHSLRSAASVSSSLNLNERPPSRLERK